MTGQDASDSKGLRRTARVVMALNLAYFAVEVVAALVIGSVSLFADSVDFLEDASIGLLLGIGLGLSAPARARLGMVLAGIILMPGIATLAMAWLRFKSQTAPAPVTLGLVGLGALAVNASCALLLSRQRARGESLVKAAFLSARNDVIGNLAIVAVAPVTAATGSPWPDLAVGLAIAALNAGAAWEVFEAARVERLGVSAGP